MDNSNKIRARDMIKELMLRFLSNRCTIVVFDPIMTFVISTYTAIIDWTGDFYKELVILIIFAVVQLAGNVVYILVGGYRHKEKEKDEKEKDERMKVIKYTAAAYDIYNSINFDMAGRLYRVNEIIKKTIKKNKIEKDSISLLIDFQTLSQNICDELYAFVKSEFNCDECEISIFQRFADGQDKGDFVNMIAYKNKNNISSSAGKNFF